MLVEDITKDPINELIWNEINPIRVMYKLKMSADPGAPTGDPKEDYKWKRLRSYNNTLRTMVRGLEGLERDHSGKEFRKEVHGWARTMLRDAQRKILHVNATVSERSEASAMMDFSKAIIEAFKKLKK